jgi:hypothetical protein
MNKFQQSSAAGPSLVGIGDIHRQLHATHYAATERAFQFRSQTWKFLETFVLRMLKQYIPDCALQILLVWLWVGLQSKPTLVLKDERIYQSNGIAQ